MNYLFNSYKPVNYTPVQDEKPIFINDDVWIAAGININIGAIIAGCSALTKEIKSTTMVGGIPAKVISR